jgi:hypothetical protein
MTIVQTAAPEGENILNSYLLQVWQVKYGGLVRLGLQTLLPVVPPLLSATCLPQQCLSPEQLICWI